MTPTSVQAYLRQLDRELRRRFVTDPSIVTEVRDHLTDAVASAQQRGDSLAAAEAEAITRFGAPEMVAAAFARDRSRAMYRWLLGAGLAFGALIAYVDGQPTWDDTGITAGTMILVAGTLGMLGPRRPWAWALAVGGGIPIYAVVRRPSAASLALLLVLVFPLAGAYLGMAARRLTTPIQP